MKCSLSLLLIFVLSSLSGCAHAQTRANKEVLVVYLSRTGNTKVLAEMIHRQVGGAIVSLELRQPYPENYRATVEQVAAENRSGFLPPLKTTINSMERYAVVFVGFPTWGMQLPPPIKSFLKQYNLAGKTIVPFNTNAGYGTGSSFQTLKELCPNSTVLEGFTRKGGVERDGIRLAIKGEVAQQAEREIKEWLRKIKLAKDG